MKQPQSAQVLVFFALVLPLVLLPAAAYAVDASVTAASFARLQQLTAVAAEEAAQQIDAVRLRSGSEIVLDSAAVEATVRRVLTASDPLVAVMQIIVVGAQVDVRTSEVVPLPLDFLDVPRITIRARAVARLTVGYDSPSSLLPLPVNTF